MNYKYTESIYNKMSTDNNSPKYNFTMEYAKLVKDEDDSDPELCHYVKPNYNVVAFSTEDFVGASMPSLFFIPKELKLPEVLSKNFYRYTYDDDPDFDLEKWLQDNAEHVLEVNKTIFAVNRKVTPSSSDLIKM